MTPISLRKRCGTSWNTEPLPVPSASIAITNSPSAAGSVAACGTPASASAATTNTIIKALTPPMRSASAPPIGRTSDPAKTQPAVQYPAITGVRPNWSVK